MSIEVVALKLGQAVAARAVRLWLDPHRAAQERRLEMGELIRRRIPGLSAQRDTERQFQTMADAAADRLAPLLAHEYRGLDEGERQAAVDAATRVLDRADLSDAALLGSDANPAALVRRIRAAAPEPDGLGEAASALHASLLAECCECYVQMVRQLPVFDGRALQEILGRTSRLGEAVATAIARLPARSLLAPDGEDFDGQFHREYLEFLARKLDRVELYGAGGGRSVSMPLSTAYISLRAREPEEPAEPPEPRGVFHTDSRVESVLGRAQRVLLRGEAGSGKTTLLRWLAVTAARSALIGELAEWNGLVPVLVRLRSHPDGRPPRPDALLDDAAGAVASHQPAGWLDRRFEDGRVLLLVDGVDELGAAERRRVREWLRDLLDRYPRTRTVVTSRPAAARSDWLREHGFLPVLLDRMSPADIEAFVRQWHRALQDRPDDIPCAVDEIPRYERTLADALQHRPHLAALAATPLLAAMLCALHLERRRQLPRNRMELYRMALELLVQRRDAERGIPGADAHGLGLTEKLGLLRDLAWRLSDNGRTELDEKRAADHLAVRLARMTARVGAAPEDVLAHLLDRSGVIRRPVDGRVDFVHRTFQEYLAAEEAMQDDRVGSLVDRAHRDTWRETVIMAAGHASARQRTELIEGLLARADAEPRHARKLRLLAGCCLETMDLVPEAVAEPLDAALGRLLPVRDSQDAQALSAIGPALLRHFPDDTSALTRYQLAGVCWCVSLIGGPEAMDRLAAWTRDGREIVNLNLVEAWPRFDAQEYADRVLSRLPLDRLTLPVRGRDQWDAARSLPRMRRAWMRGHHGPEPLGQQFPALAELAWSELPFERIDAAHFRGMTELDSLDLVAARPTVCDGELFRELPALTALGALGVEIDGLAEGRTPLPGTLRSLVLSDATPSDGSAVLRLRGQGGPIRLTKLHLDNRGLPLDLTEAEPFPDAVALTLDDADLTAALPLLPALFPAAETMDLTRAVLPDDLAPLAALPRLRTLDLRGATGGDLDTLLGRAADAPLVVKRAGHPYAECPDVVRLSPSVELHRPRPDHRPRETSTGRP